MGRVLHPSQCIYSYIAPPHPRSTLSSHALSLVSPTPSEFTSPPRLQEKNEEAEVYVRVGVGGLCTFSVQTFTHVTVGLPATTIDLLHLFRWRRPCGKDFHRVFPVMHRGARH